MRDVNLTHVNRCGDTYYLQSKQTKTGGLQYYCGRKLTGTPLTQLPDGYEVYEAPETGQVYLRRPKDHQILPEERGLLEAELRKYPNLQHALVDVQERSLVVYLPSLIDAGIDDLLAQIFSAPLGREAARNSLLGRSHYQKMLRFNLLNARNADGRAFWVERWCFKESIDGWISLGPPASLSDQIAKYLPHLGQESFYSLGFEL
jgi:hypothetical protein